jgi:hypothetical protein
MTEMVEDIGEHGPEAVARDAAEEGARHPEPGETDGDVEVRAAGHGTSWHFSALAGPNEEIDQRFAADQDHDRLPLLAMTPSRRTMWPRRSALAAA